MSADYRGPERRRSTRGPAWLRLLSALCVIAVFAAIGGLFLKLDGEIDRARKADNASEFERRVTSCVVRGVLELSLDRAEQRGELDLRVVIPRTGQVVTSGDLLRAAIEPLREDCPPLVIPAEDEPPPPIPGSRPAPRTR